MKLIRTDNTDPHFKGLTAQLDAELRQRYGEKQADYDQNNVVDQVPTVVVGYLAGRPVACGCIRTIDTRTTELKRMYVERDCRSKGYAALVVAALEEWARELGFFRIVLDTGTGQPEAIRLYRRCGYTTIENYGPFTGDANIICMEKQLIQRIPRNTRP